MAGIAARLRLPPQVQDVLLAAFVTVTQIQGTSRVAADPAVVARQLTDFGNLGYVLLTISGLVLVARRRLPVAVFAVTAVISLTYFWLDFPDGPGWIALFVALYTLTAYGDGQRSIRIAAAGIAVLSVSWLLTADLQPGAEAGWVAFRIGAAIMAAALGESVRSRRVIAVEAQERADRAERTREEEARRRVDAERLRIAREVHDTVAHAIAVINVQAGVTAHVLEKRPERARETLMVIEQTSAQALRELRATLQVLRAADDGQRAPHAGLSQVDELVAVAREAGLDVKLETGTPSTEVPGAVDGAAFRILQEAITNVIRHAGPARVTVSINYSPTDLEIKVADDGRGIGDAPDKVPAGSGRGIAGMRERCALLGGRLTAGPREEGGFQVHARLPLKSPGTVPR